MSYEVKPGDIFGRIGTELGKGLSDQIPKEVERHRLSKGLKELGAQKDLSPFQRLAAFYSIPGAADRPELIRSGTEFLKQQGMLDSLGSGSQGTERKPTFSDIRQEPLPSSAGIDQRSITTPEGVSATVKPYIPMTTPQKQQLAIDLHQQNPNLYPDYQTAYSVAENIDQENQVINSAKQQQRKGEQDVQSTVVKELRERAKTLGANSGVNLPGNVMSELEDRAISEINKGKKSEKEIATEYGKEIDKIMRQYSDVRSIGNWGITGRGKQSASDFKRAQREFSKRGDTKNLAELMQVENGISPMLSYSLAQPIDQIPEVEKSIRALPKLKSIETLFETVYPDRDKKTLEVIPNLAREVAKTGASPLAVGYELKKKGYDPSLWLDYLSENSEKLDLRPSQIEQLTKKTNYIFEPLNDLWLSEWTGLGD